MSNLLYQLEIQQSGGNFTFEVPGTFSPRFEPTWKEAVEPPEIESMRIVWEFQGARIVAADGTADTLWSDFMAFAAILRQRGDTGNELPTYARVVRDPAGDAEVIWTLGGSGYEKFRIEVAVFGQDALNPAAQWNVSTRCRLVISAVEKYADTDGIVGWNQEVSETWDDGGHHIIEWNTTITTKESAATSAKTLSLTYGLIPLPSSAYSYQTGNATGYGIDFVLPDSDENNSRQPTVCQSICRVKQWGITVGASAPGAAPTTFRLDISTTTTWKETVVTRTASARGPGSLAWVKNQKPGQYNEAEVTEERATNGAHGTWTTRTPAAKTYSRISVELTGGYPTIDFEPVVGFEPVMFVGAQPPFRCDVEVEVFKVGGDGKVEEFLLPAELPDPWIMDRQNVVEGDPYIAEFSLIPNRHEWRRKASVSYFAKKKPSTRPMDWLREKDGVQSYILA